LCIWNVEPGEKWDPQQRIITLEDELCHVVIRLRRFDGDGFAIVLSQRP
jgi:hypothetical protein